MGAKPPARLCEDLLRFRPQDLDSQFISAASTKAARTNVALLGMRWRASVPASSAEVAVRLHFRRSPHGAGGAAQVGPAKRSRTEAG